VFVVVYFIGAASLALWLDARFPQLAPESFRNRFLAAILATLILPRVPVETSSRTALMTTLMLAVLPALVFSFLTALWLLRALRDGIQSQRL
jgi:hypothetical protein